MSTRMEPDSPIKTRRRPATAKPKSPQSMGVGSVRSSHVIDLRQQPGAAALEPAPEPRPQPKATPAAPKRPAPSRRPQPRKQEVEPQLPELTESMDVVESPIGHGRRRFWPAFGRFLLLVLVLGVIVAIGFYIYLTYFLQA